MAFTEPQKVRRIGTYSAATKAKRVRILNRRESKATERHQVAKIAKGMRDKKQSWRDIEDHIETLSSAGTLRRTYSHETIRQLVSKLAAGATSDRDFMDRPRTGRPCRIDGNVLTDIRVAVYTDTAFPISTLYERLARKAEKLGVPMPSYDTIKRKVAELGRTAQTAGRFGVKAAQLEAMPHGAVPAQWPHDVWVIDELDAPFYSRIFDRVIEEWVSVRAAVVLVVDHRTTAIVGYWLVDTTHRRDAQSGEIMRAGFQASDVLAALLSAAWGRNLATPSNADFAGWLPRVIRWDNHRTHGSLRPILETLGERLSVDVSSFHARSRDVPMTSFADWAEVEVEGVRYSDERGGIVVPRLPGYRPINRGQVESVVGVIKKMCLHVDSHVDRVIPLDRLKVSPKWERDVSAGNGSRAFRREPIDVMRLPTIDDTRAMLEGLIYRYNHEEVPRRLGMTRRAKYREQWRDGVVRPGADLLAALENKSTFVTEHGIVHHHDNTETAFSHIIEGRLALLLDTPVDYKPDPLLRGLFVAVDQKWYWVPRKIEYASQPGRAEQVARQANADARSHAAQANQARAAKKDATYGSGAAAADERAAEDILRQARRAGNQEGGVAPSASPVKPSKAPAPSPASPETAARTLLPVRSRFDRLTQDPGQSAKDDVA